MGRGRERKREQSGVSGKGKESVMGQRQEREFLNGAGICFLWEGEASLENREGDGK